MVVTILLGALGLLALAYAILLWRTAAAKGAGRPSLEGIGLGAITNFFDTLGIGSFAPTTAWIKLRRLTPDSYIPATLNSGHALPAMAQSGIFLVLLGVSVDPVLLASCVGAAVLGAAVGAPLVLKAPVRLVQGMIGLALVIAACLYAAANLDLMPVGGSASGLEGPALWLAIAAHFVLGALMTFGIGLYAPSLILLSLMGLDPRLAFPVMASACAFLMPVGAFRFVRSERIDLRLVLGLALGGVPAVLIAAFVVKELPVEMLRWGVVAVALYAAVLLLLAAIRPSQAEDAET
ncbi:TSUP family transporter [Brevundimonas sp.]|uniref:TSUP family transporter n=1 Tax=Brevundimonas sp. TaxID=1871086 RepID=UPI0025ED2A6E|nr:TSUP family transporter [Brevundimonas sp.]